MEEIKVGTIKTKGKDTDLFLQFESEAEGSDTPYPMYFEFEYQGETGVVFREIDIDYEGIQTLIEQGNLSFDAEWAFAANGRAAIAAEIDSFETLDEKMDW